MHEEPLITSELENSGPLGSERWPVFAEFHVFKNGSQKTPLGGIRAEGGQGVVLRPKKIHQKTHLIELCTEVFEFLPKVHSSAEIWTNALSIPL